MIKDYAELAMTVADHTGIDDLAPHFSRICGLAEVTLNKELRHARMHKTRTLLLDKDRRSRLPDDFLEPERVQRSDDTADLARQSSLEVLRRHRLHGYAVENGFIEVYPGLEAVLLTYYAKLPPLEVNDSNWLLEDDPELYLHACAFQAFTWKRQVDEASVERGYLTGLIQERIAQDDRARFRHARVYREACSP